MIDQNQINKLAEFFTLNKEALLVFPKTQDQDLLLATLAYYLFLKNLFTQEVEGLKLKSVSLLSPSEIKNPFSRIPSLKDFLKEGALLSELKNELGKENLVVSFPYNEERVDKVSYHIGEDSQRFYLTIKPRKGVEPLDSKKVEFSYVGSDADLLFLFGVGDLEDLAQLYYGYEDFYQNTAAVTFNNFIPDFGTLNLDISGSTSYCESLFYLLKNLLNIWQMDLFALEDADQIATLLLAGINLKTDNFTSLQMKAETFSAIAELLHLGGRRLNLENKAIVPAKKKVGRPSKKKTKTVVVK